MGVIRRQKKSGALNLLKREMMREWSEMKFLEQIVASLKNPIHPKLTYLTDLLYKFFEEKGSGSRAIVFTQSRASANEIERYLMFKLSNVTPRIFVGQGDRDDSRGMSQAEQTRIVKWFKKGYCNTLIATCVAEEGLDIGEVDLIVCYDSGLSPVRMVQRMGRTGRKREGRVILLLMDKEYSIYSDAEDKRKQITDRMKEIFNGNEGETHYYSCNPRMLPDEVLPKLRLVVSENQGPVAEAPKFNTLSFNIPICLNQDEIREEKTEKKQENGKQSPQTAEKNKEAFMGQVESQGNTIEAIDCKMPREKEELTKEPTENNEKIFDSATINDPQKPKINSQSESKVIKEGGEQNKRTKDVLKKSEEIIEEESKSEKENHGTGFFGEGTGFDETMEGFEQPSIIIGEPSEDEEFTEQDEEEDDDEYYSRKLKEKILGKEFLIDSDEEAESKQRELSTDEYDSSEKLTRSIFDCQGALQENKKRKTKIRTNGYLILEKKLRLMQGSDDSD